MLWLLIIVLSWITILHMSGVRTIKFSFAPKITLILQTIYKYKTGSEILVCATSTSSNKHKMSNK